MGRRGVQIGQEGAAEVDDGCGGVDGDVGEERDVLAAMRVRSQMLDGGMSQEDNGHRRHLLLHRLESLRIECFIPSNIDQDLDSSVELQE